MSASINQEIPFTGKVKQKVIPASSKNKVNSFSFQTKSMDDRFLSEKNEEEKEWLSDVSEL